MLGIANEHSIAYGCACASGKLGAELAITYLNDKAKPYVEPLAQQLEASLFAPLNVQQAGQMEAVFDRVRQTWGRLDIALHAIAFAPKEDLQGGLLNCSAAGFGLAVDVSCHSFVRMARLAAPLMTEGGTLLAMSYHGANKVMPSYAVMGPVKAALEAAVRYLAMNWGRGASASMPFRPVPIQTRAASGLKDFDLLLSEAAQRGPYGELVDIDDVGMATAYLATPYRPAADRQHALRGWRSEHYGVGAYTSRTNQTIGRYRGGDEHEHKYTMRLTPDEDAASRPGNHGFPRGRRLCDRFLATFAHLPRYSPAVRQPTGGDDLPAGQRRVDLRLRGHPEGRQPATAGELCSGAGRAARRAR